MSIFCYVPTTDLIGLRLQEMVEALAAGEKVGIYGSLEELSDRLRVPGNDWKVGVLLVVSKDDLLQLLSIRGLLRDLRIILVLPDREKETIARGHKLRPRFLTYVDSDLAEVGAVLSKMLSRSRLQR